MGTRQSEVKSLGGMLSRPSMAWVKSEVVTGRESMAHVGYWTVLGDTLEKK
jgi:hypothetical protein